VPEVTEGVRKINPFVSSLSALNSIFSLSMTVFSFAIIIYLEGANLPVYLAGIGLTVGQAILIGISMFQGRAIDKGHSFTLMITGGFLYGISLALLYLVISKNLLIVGLIPAFIAIMIISEGFFRASLNSFIAKASATNILGKNYARIMTGETVGSSFAYAVLILGAVSYDISYVFLGSGLLLVCMAFLAFFVLYSKEKEAMKGAANQVRRPGLFEGLRSLKERRKFVVPLISSKAMMTVGVIGFSLFYVPSGLILGIPIEYSFGILLLTYILASVLGRFSEKFIDSKSNFGRRFISLTMLLDVVTYGLILLAIFLKSEYLFLGAALFSSPGIITITGAMSYEVTVIGRENRGIFGGVQRQIVGVAAALVSWPLTLFYSLGFQYLWEIVWAASIISLLITFSIPNVATIHPPEGQPH
jgi:MFS family permease